MIVDDLSRVMCTFLTQRLVQRKGWNSKISGSLNSKRWISWRQDCCFQTRLEILERNRNTLKEFWWKIRVEGVISIGVNVNRGGRKEETRSSSSREGGKNLFPRSTTRKLRFDAAARGRDLRVSEKGTAYAGEEKIGRKITSLRCPL